MVIHIHVDLHGLSCHTIAHLPLLGQLLHGFRNVHRVGIEVCEFIQVEIHRHFLPVRRARLISGLGKHAELLLELPLRGAFVIDRRRDETVLQFLGANVPLDILKGAVLLVLALFKLSLSPFLDLLEVPFQLFSGLVLPRFVKKLPSFDIANFTSPINDCFLPNLLSKLIVV